MDCAQAGEHLPLYIGDDLPIGALNAVRQHLRECSRCRATAEEYLATLDLVREWSAPRFDAESSERIHEAVMARLDSAHRPSSPSTPSIWTRPLALAASLAVVALFVWLAMHAIRRHDDVGEPRMIANDPAPAADDHPPSGDDERSLAAPRPKQILGRTRHARVLRRSAPSAANDVAPNATAETMRIEFQTSDPNVRIIWFVPKGETASPQNERRGS